jgi:O-antigen/teichoic acid export membrane protein
MGVNNQLSTLLVIVFNIANAIVLALTFIYLANVMGPSNFGLFTFVFTVGAFPPIFTGLGSESVLLMFASRDSTKLNYLFGNAIAIRFIFSVLVLVVIFVISFIFSIENNQLIIIAIAAALLNGFNSSLYSAVFRVLGMHLKSVLFTFFGSIIFGVIILISANKSITPLEVILGSIISYLCIFLVVTFIILRHVRPIFSYKNWQDQKQLGIKFSLSQLMDLLFQRVDILILQLLLGSASVGLYSASNRITSALILFPSALQFVFLQDFHRNAFDKNLLHKTFKRFLLFILESSGFIIGVIFWNSDLIINILYTNQYTNAGLLLRLLCISLFLIFIGYPYSMQAEAQGLVGKRLNFRVITLAITLLLCFVAIPIFKEAGAAISVIIGTVFFNAQLHYAAFRNFRISKKTLLYLAKLAALFIISGLIVLFFHKIYEGNRTLLLFISCFIYFLIYLSIGFISNAFQVINYKYLCRILLLSK